MQGRGVMPKWGGGQAQGCEALGRLLNTGSTLDCSSHDRASRAVPSTEGSRQATEHHFLQFVCFIMLHLLPASRELTAEAHKTS